MEVTFSTPKEIVVLAEKKTTIDKITINQMVDNPARKTVIVHTRELGSIVLWKDDEYDTIGQWTDSDVQAKLTALYGS